VARDRTEAERPRRLYYGWVMVGALALVLSLAVSMAGTNVALFVKPMSRDLEISQAVFGWAYAARLMAVGVSAPLIGRLLDQHGARWMLAGASLLTGGMILSLAFVSAPWEIIAVFVGMGLVGFVGGSQLYTMVPVAKWFVRRRGRAMALTFIGGNLGMIVLIPTTQWVIAEWGWRTAWFLLGSAGGVAIAVISVVFVRRQPEDMGLLPDGAAPTRSDDGGQAARDARDEQAMSRSAALRTGAFWRLAIVFGLMQFASGTRVVYSIPFFVDRGISPQIAAFGLSSAVFGGMTVTLILSIYVDRFQVRHIGAVGFLLLLGSTLLTIVTHEPWQMFLTYIQFNAGLAALSVTQNTIWPNYFGRAHLGSIRGAATPVMLGFSVLAAPLTGGIKALSDSYVPAWWIAVAAIVLAVPLILTTHRPKPKQETAAESPPSP
jgi:MFS family permease